MREYRYRGFRRKTQEWVFGFIVKREDPYLHDIVIPIGDASSITYAVERGSLGEYTGLRDTTGRKIYTGDIVHTEGHYPGEGWFDTGEHDYNFKATVIWDDKELTYSCGGYKLSELDKVTVIGNIFENPELIKEEV